MQQINHCYSNKHVFALKSTFNSLGSISFRETSYHIIPGGGGFRCIDLTLGGSRNGDICLCQIRVQVVGAL